MSATDKAPADLVPVAWRHRGPKGGWIVTEENHPWSEEPLTPLDEATERIAALEKQAARATAEKAGLLMALKHHTGHDHGIMAIRSLVERAETAEAAVARYAKLMGGEQ